MLPIPHGVPAPLVPYAPALLVLVAALAGGWFCRGKRHRAWLRVAMALAGLLGWAAITPFGRLRGAALSPSFGPDMLIVPAALVVGIEALLVWRGGRHERWAAVASALGVGWWLARVGAGPGEFWRVWVVVAMLAGSVAFVVRRDTRRGAALALALWGGAYVAGWPASWVAAAAVLAAPWLALLVLRAEAAMPTALVAATLASADLARGRLPRGHFGAADLVCLLALAAPFVAGWAETRLGRRWAGVAPALGAAGVVAAGWGLRRALF
ncbi:MAG: hypothetical protein RQ966_02455 [Acetobacteraceae bacterium]|nr:hypothetical protein [Acetobacteraceae bacterium]